MGLARALTFRSRRSSLNFSLQPGEITEISGARAARHFWRQRDHRSHLAGRQHQEELHRPGNTCWSNGVNFVDFNSYGSRRGNDRVMTRGTFANVRIKNLMVPGIEGGVTKFQPTGDTMSDLTMRR